MSRQESAINRLTWPYVFQAPSMDRSQNSHLANPDRLPWLIGIDGRHRGGLHTYLGHTKFSGSPIRKSVVKISITDYTLKSGHSLTIDGFGAASPVVLTEGSEWTASGSNAVTASSLYSAINSAVTTTAFPEMLYVSASVNSATVTLTVYHLGLNTGTITWSSIAGVSMNPVSGQSPDNVLGTPLTTVANGAGVYLFAADVDFCKYVELRKTGNTVQRGFVVRDDETGWVLFFYNEGFSSSAPFTGAHLIDATGDFLGLRMSVTYLNKVLYIVGTDGTTSRQKVVYWDEDQSTHVTANMGPAPTLSGTDYGDGLLIYGTATAVTSSNLGGHELTVLQGAGASGDIIGVEWDPTNEKIIYADVYAQRIYRMDVDGTNREELITTSGADPLDIAFDPVGNKLYVLYDRGSNEIIRYDPDGTNATTVLNAGGAVDPKRLCVDSANNRVYITDEGIKDIAYVDLSSLPATAITAVTTGYATRPTDIDIDRANGYLYVSRTGTAVDKVLISSGATVAQYTTAATANAIQYDALREHVYVNLGTQIYKLTPDLLRALPILQTTNISAANVRGIVVQPTYPSAAQYPAPVGLFSVFDPGTTRADSRLSAGAYDFRVRYYDPVRLRYSTLSPQRTVFMPSIADTGQLDSGAYFQFTYGGDDVFLPALRGYSLIQWWSTISSGVDDSNNPNRPGGTLYLRGTYDLPTDNWFFEFGKGGAEDTTDDIGGVDEEAFSDGADGLTDLAMVRQSDVFLPTFDSVNPEIPDFEAIHYYQGSLYGLGVSEGFLDIRWSPLDRVEPENFPLLNSKRTLIPAVGVASFIEAGDYLWILGDNESYRIQKLGAAHSIHKKLSGYKFVGPRCACAVGSNIIAVTTSGVLNIDANSGNYAQISSLDQIILKRWSNNLEANGEDQKIQVAYDSRLGAVYIWNRHLGECAILWTTTNRVTFLKNAWFQYLTSGFLPNSRSDGQRVFWITETQDTTTTELFNPGGGFFLYPRATGSSGVNMLGLTEGSDTTDDIESLLSTAIGGATVNADGKTKMTFATGSAAENEPGRFTSGVLHVLTGTLAGNAYRIVASESGSSTRVTIHLEEAIHASLSSSDVFSIAPVEVGVVGWPLGSTIFSQDMLSRRIVEVANAVLGSAAGQTTAGTSWGHLTYGLCRIDDLNDDQILDAVSTDPIDESPRGFPWTDTWSATTDPAITLDPSSPAQLYRPLEGDGGILLPTVSCVVSGLTFNLLGLYLAGTINPNEGLDPT